jgi:hypothetical protein
MLIGLLAGIASAVLFGAAAVLQASAVRALGGQSASFVWFVRFAWREPLLLAVVAAYLAGFVLHAVAIWFTPLYLAQATISLSLPITAWVAVRRLGERLGPAGWSAVGSIAAGLVLLAISAGAAGEALRSAPFVAFLWLGVVVIGAVGWWGLAARPAIAATVAGFGYAGSALAVRGVDGYDTVSLLSASAVPAYGLIAFWLYSLALDRSSAASASGSVIVYQTLVPSLVGVIWLGDRVRDGLGFGVVGGLILAVGGALALSRRGGRVG